MDVTAGVVRSELSRPELAVSEDGAYRPDMPSDDHALVNRATWDEDARNWVQRGRDAWARKEPVWGRGNPESELHPLPDLMGLDVVELGCGTAYVSAWLMRRGARVTGLDNSSNQLATARMLQKEFSLCFPLVHADAERPPFADASFDFVISQYGAATWCDPYRWIPEAARLLRPGGRLVFMAQSTLARMCLPEQGPATDRLVRDLFGLHRVVWRGTSGTEYRVFTLPHGEWIRLLAGCGLVVEDLIEVRVPAGATNNDFPEFPDEWVRRWPAEEVWFARRR